MSVKSTVASVRCAACGLRSPVTNSSISSTMESNSPAQANRSGPGNVMKRAPSMCSAR